MEQVWVRAIRMDSKLMAWHGGTKGSIPMLLNLSMNLSNGCQNSSIENALSNVTHPILV